MAELSELEVNLLQFVLKSFALERVIDWNHRNLAVFERTETESESKFRPRIIKLRTIIPQEWVIYDMAADALFIGQDGITPGPRTTGAALEAAADKSEFHEQGVEWRRRVVSDLGVVYVPAALADELFSDDGIRRLQSLLSQPVGT